MDLNTLRDIDTWLRENIVGCRFVGLSEDQELFVEYDDPTPELETLVADRLRELFPKDVKTIIQVVKPSLIQLEASIRELNRLLANQEAPQEPLLQIEDF